MGNNENLIFVILICFVGLFSILGSVFNWDFFFENRKATTFVKIFGRNGARIFYAIIGILLIVLAFKI